jgi:hypothetical protein
MIRKLLKELEETCRQEDERTILELDNLPQIPELARQIETLQEFLKDLPTFQENEDRR